ARNDDLSHKQIGRFFRATGRGSFTNCRERRRRGIHHRHYPRPRREPCARNLDSDGAIKNCQRNRDSVVSSKCYTMIKVENLTKRYAGQTAIQDLNFEVSRGEIMGFLGPNGAGKTTTMRILAGFMPPTSGRASIAGFDVFEQS